MASLEDHGRNRPPKLRTGRLRGSILSGCATDSSRSVICSRSANSFGAQPRPQLAAALKYAADARKALEACATSGSAILTH